MIYFLLKSYRHRTYPIGISKISNVRMEIWISNTVRNENKQTNSAKIGDVVQIAQRGMVNRIQSEDDCLSIM